MPQLVLGAIYAVFFCSGAAALIYEVIWVRSLSLIFGGSHLAVTTVLSVFMGGLALGSYLIGKRIDRYGKLLRLYGALELGIGASAVLSALLFKLYPFLYVPLAQVAVTSPVYLSFIRVIFAVVALIVPTTLMGGTLPLLSKFVSRRAKSLGSHISFLYGFNTLGAVAGVAAASFILLRHYSVSTTMAAAVSLNILAGAFSILLQDRAEVVLGAASPEDKAPDQPPTQAGDPPLSMSLRLVLWGIGVSGFCALGYEVLWTRVLSVAIGASTYGFAIMLIAFLAGIAIGSTVYGLLAKRSSTQSMPLSRVVVWFGFVQILIGISALAVTAYIRDLPGQEGLLQNVFLRNPSDRFVSRQWVNLALACSYMFIPAFFMGVAFPMAGKVHASYKKLVGRAVGEVLAFNTVGAILGSAVSGFVLIYLFGIERSLQLITLINMGWGIVIILSVRNRTMPVVGASALTLALIVLLVFNPDRFRMWDARFLATYLSTSNAVKRNTETFLDKLNVSHVLYYAEGSHAIVSSIRNRAGVQTFITNGRPEASNGSWDMQCQYTLGHLPMLLHKNPRSVFVLGSGSGMTLGATSVHPSVERITLAEIEPKVLGVTRTFAKYNHNVLDSRKLRIVFNDGRNYLLTTKEKFDVITADPIHPWFSGAGYLYTAEYFKLAAERLNPGGIICQWLPIYEMTGENLKSVVRTLGANFKYVMVWLTHYDAEIIGSNSPIIIDEEDMDRRIAEPDILRDLEQVTMGSARDFLSYFVMGTEGVRAYSRGGTLNTDDNLYLEFSAPESMGDGTLMAKNVFELSRYRESIIPYLYAPRDEVARKKQLKAWEAFERASVVYDRAHAMYLNNEFGTPGFKSLMADLDSLSPKYAPWIFLKNEYREAMERNPRPLWQMTMDLIDMNGAPVKVRLAAVISRMSREYAIIDFVDNTKRVIFGTLEVTGENKEKQIHDMADDIRKGIQEAYQAEQKAALGRGQALPGEAMMLPRIKTVITSMIASLNDRDRESGN
jgi:spermidine synthase